MVNLTFWLSYDHDVIQVRIVKKELNSMGQVIYVNFNGLFKCRIWQIQIETGFQLDWDFWRQVQLCQNGWIKCLPATVYFRIDGT